MSRGSPAPRSPHPGRPAPPGRSRWYYLRVLLLLLVLLGVALWRVRVLADENRRVDWRFGHDVLVCPLLAAGSDWQPLAAPAADGASRLERWGGEEMRRLMGVDARPLRFQFAPPVEASGRPPKLPGGGASFFDRWRATSRFLAWFRAYQDRFPVPIGGGSRIYLFVDPRASFRSEDSVESVGTRRGRVGIVFAGDDPAEWGNTLAVILHESLHTLGAAEHRDAEGNVLLPQGFAAPDARPLFPQSRAEVMALGIPVSESEELRVSSLDEVVMGEATAREIGWLP